LAEDRSWITVTKLDIIINVALLIKPSFKYGHI